MRSLKGSQAPSHGLYKKEIEEHLIGEGKEDLIGEGKEEEGD